MFALALTARLARSNGLDSEAVLNLGIYCAMAGIAGRLGDRGVSLESIVQRRPPGAQIGIAARLKPGAPTPVILITHETTEEAMRGALAAIEKDGNVSERPQMIRIEPL